MDNPGVLVIGAACLDVKGQPAGPLEMGTSNPGTVRRSVGGVARNIAENLARFGVETTLLSAVGDDEAGRWLVDQARQVGINVEHVLVVSGARTGAYLALLDRAGHLMAAVDDNSVLEAITPRYLNDRRRLFRDAEMVVLDTNLSPQALTTVFRLAQQYHVPVCADPTSTVLAPRLRPHLYQLHLITPNLEEAGALVGVPVREPDGALAAAKQLVGMGVELAVITLAEKGLCYATSNESGSLPAIAVEVVDRTGVGDALTAAVIFGLLEEFPPDEAVRLGLSAAALTLQCCDTVCPDLSLERLYDQLVI